MEPINMKHKKPKWTIKRIKNRLKHLMQKQYVANHFWCYGCSHLHNHTCDILDPLEGECK